MARVNGKPPSLTVGLIEGDATNAGSSSPWGNVELMRSISQGTVERSSSGLLTKAYGLESPFLPTKPPILDSTDLDIDSLLTEEMSRNSSPSGSSNLKGSWFRKLLAFTGPGWLMSIAYVDPGNLEADLQSGAQFGYTLLWALMWATGMGLGMQLIAARLGCATGRHLAEHCREQYDPGARIFLWLFTELAIIGSDIQEVIGCSIGLQILTGMPLPAGVVLTATLAFCFLFLERLGTRKLELFFGVLILILAVSMGVLFSETAPDKAQIVRGLVIPEMPASAVQQVVGMVGCVVMPHNLFLHSALVQSRVIRPEDQREAIYFFTIESAVAIAVSLMINLFVVAVFAKGFYDTPGAADIGLRNAGDYLSQAFDWKFRIIWALGLVAAGQSSTMTGAYAGQWVMQGYLDLQVSPWKRAVITRGMALVPTLFVAIYFGGGHGGLDALNGYLNILQSLVLPFALVPLLIFAGSADVMGDLALSKTTLVVAWIATGLVMVVNVYLFWEKFADVMPLGCLISIAGIYSSGVAYVFCSPRAVLSSRADE